MIFEQELDIVVASGATAGGVKEESLEIRGVLGRILFVIPDLDDSDTAELKIRNSDGEDDFTSGELAESTTHKMCMSLPLAGVKTFRVECSGAQAAARTITLYLTVEK